MKRKQKRRKKNDFPLARNTATNICDRLFQSGFLFGHRKTRAFAL